MKQYSCKLILIAEVELFNNLLLEVSNSFYEGLIMIIVIYLIRKNISIDFLILNTIFICKVYIFSKLIAILLGLCRDLYSFV